RRGVMRSRPPARLPGMSPEPRPRAVPGAALPSAPHPRGRGGGCPPLFVLGNPMEAEGFSQLVAEIGDRTVLTYDRRGTARSTLEPDGGVRVEDHAADLHAVAQAAAVGPLDVLGSSGGGVTGLAWAAAHPDDVRCLVAHEPPLTALLEDRDIAVRAQADIVRTYDESGFGPAMAKFVRLVFATEPLTEAFLDQPDPGPARYGMPAE